MRYFSYNDFIDCTENGEIDKVLKVEEKIARYEAKNKKTQDIIDKNKIIEILRKKSQLKLFLKEFIDFYEIEDINNINYCNNIKSISDKENHKNKLIIKMKDKEIFIFINVIEKIDTNISYKMFEHSLNIIKRWNIEEKTQNKRYPIVIPIVIYTGKEIWKNSFNKVSNKINYVSFEKNRTNFFYNLININDLKTKDLVNMKNSVAKELIAIKTKYLKNK